MSKPLFYVPVVLVVSGEDDIVAKENADEIVEGLMRLSPRDLSGYTFTEQFGVFPASPNWFDKDQNLVVSQSKAHIEEQ